MTTIVAHLTLCEQLDMELSLVVSQRSSDGWQRPSKRSSASQWLPVRGSVPCVSSWRRQLQRRQTRIRLAATQSERQLRHTRAAMWSSWNRRIPTQWRAGVQ